MARMIESGLLFKTGSWFDEAEFFNIPISPLKPVLHEPFFTFWKTKPKPKPLSSFMFKFMKERLSKNQFVTCMDYG